jgi:cellulose synthase/poly-beta-1,6-N-acetylglucosamine synthase-like glycosyltransferase
LTVKVTVGLCLKNSRHTVETALYSIAKQDYPHEALKLVVVDEEESGKVPACITNFTKNTDIQTILFLTQNKGLGAARQMVIDNAEGDYVVWVDDDFVLEKDFITQHVAFMEQNPQIGAALAEETTAETRPVIIFEGYLRIIGKLNQKTTVMGGFEIFRLKAIKQAGGFDVNIKGAAEDRDISIRIKNLGWQFSINRSAQYYRKYPPTTYAALWRKHFWYGYGSHFLFHKYPSQKSRWELFFPSAFWIGFRDSLKVYKVIPERKVFFLGPYYLFRSAASFLGFFRADLDKYGHTSTTKTHINK